VKSAEQLLVSQLRGTLKEKGLGARGLEHVARNPGCKRLRALTLLSVGPLAAAREVYGLPVEEGMSQFTIEAGMRFEARLFENGAAALLDLYRKAGLFGPTECKVSVISAVAPGWQPADLARRLAETDRLLRAKLRRDPSAPNVVVKPLLVVNYVGWHYIEPDMLRAADSDPFYMVGEVKSYVNRGGKTNEADLRSAFRQAAVGVFGLRQTLARLGALDPAGLVSARADLVLRRPGSMSATLTPGQAITGEVASVERALLEAPRDLAELRAMVPPGATIDDRATLDSIPNNYRSVCREFCPLAGLCKEQALAAGEPVLLGDLAREELIAAGSVPRAIELMHGRARPRTLGEQVLADRLRDGLAGLAG
jgi:hypothetical protein